LFVVNRYLPDIIGKGGAVIRALKDHTGVKITVPPTTNKVPGPDGKIPKIKIGLAGPKEKVSQTRALIKDLCKFYVTPITHPGSTYAEMDINKNYYNYIIGSKGSEIKHIQNSYKVNVHIPDENSINPNIILTGEPDSVESARHHIEKIIERVDNIAAKAAAEASGSLPPKPKGGNGTNSENISPRENVSPDRKHHNKGGDRENSKSVAPPAPGLQLGGGGKSNWTGNAPRGPPEEPEEAWTRDFLPPSSIPMDIASMLPPGAKYSASAPAPIGTTNNATTLATTDSNPTPSGVPTEPKVPASTSAWNNIPGQW
jgi:rRNA processing protein Krr1/Pno1